LSTKNIESKIYLLDTMVLINFTERCLNHDIFGYFEKLGVRFQIVEEVKKEFFKKVKPLGETRFRTYTRNNILQTISNDDIEVDIETMNYFVGKGFGRGELFSALYYIGQSNLKLVSDDRVVQKVFEEKFNEKLTRTHDLLTVLVKNDIVTEKQADEIMDEMIENGFWIKK
jgi:predicted nucleic acid-binding protein